MDCATFKEAYEKYGADALYNVINDKMKAAYNHDRREKRKFNIHLFLMRAALIAMIAVPVFGAGYLAIHAIQKYDSEEHSIWLKHRLSNMAVCSAGQTTPCQRALDWELGEKGDEDSAIDTNGDHELYAKQLKAAYRDATGRRIYSTTGG